MKKVTLFAFVILLVMIGLVQFVPYGKDHANPPVLQEPAWPTLEIRAMAKESCFDCHSNETVWPWYTNIAPMSWLIQRDVDEGREKINFSEWGLGPEGSEHWEHLAEVVREGEMPPIQYILLHPGARLNAGEKEKLAQGFEQIPGVKNAGESDKD